MQTILYSNKKLGKVRKYKVRWVMEFPDEWLACDKVPKDLKDMFETRNRNRKERQKKLNSLSDKLSDVKLFGIQQNEV
jgi:Skp family chaperone for outer membrane proteins